MPNPDSHPSRNPRARPCIGGISYALPSTARSVRELGAADFSAMAKPAHLVLSGFLDSGRVWEERVQPGEVLAGLHHGVGGWVRLGRGENVVVALDVGRGDGGALLQRAGIPVLMRSTPSLPGRKRALQTLLLVLLHLGSLPLGAQQGAAGAGDPPAGVSTLAPAPRAGLSGGGRPGGAHLRDQLRPGSAPGRHPGVQPLPARQSARCRVPALNAPHSPRPEPMP